MSGKISDRDNTPGRVCAGDPQNGVGRTTRKGRPVLNTAPAAVSGEEVGRWQILGRLPDFGFVPALRQAQGEALRQAQGKRFAPRSHRGHPQVGGIKRFSRP